ncbi:fungal-specific transcription factor domain-domain-containing protein [Aspergillus taichungensis]|uniref:Fungal-specific transcription factor domain-domain-containing protein n=1 Tax=Aspergillus taichungensis TaxID=482145 RepID=A0A2J5I9U8_9EURO|nr:fungal-specific transcription factor domain-domain-containing protein [Aspergillus taichungensis]
MERLNWGDHPVHLEPLELEILERRDAFGLPPKATCDDLVDVFFKWISPILPVVNRHEFMKRYHHVEGGPSILLLQAMFTVSSRFVTGRQSQTDTAISPRSFYKKAKALYDAGYEQDILTVLQSVTLLGVYWDGLDDLTESGLFYWSRLGIALAQELGFHEREKYLNLSQSKQGLWKRIWWTLYTRDRSVAAAFGRPLHIHADDCTVEELAEGDFVEHDEELQIEFPIDELRAQFFIHYVKLCQLMDLGLCSKLSSWSAQANRRIETAQCELALNEWLVSCPPQLEWRQSRHNFLSAMLFSTFHTLVCQLHLLQAPASSLESRNSAFHSASTVISILETLQSHGELTYSPSFIICHAVVSFVTLKCQMEVSMPSLLHAIRLKLEANLEIMKVLSQAWPIADIFLELFQTLTSPERFDHLLSAAVEACRKRAGGEQTDTSGPAGPFRRPKVKQVILPQSRLVLQILRRETFRQPTNLYQASDAANQDPALSGEYSSHIATSEFSNDDEPTSEALEPSAVLRNLQEMIRLRQNHS